MKDLWNEKVLLRPDHPFLVFEDKRGKVQRYSYREFDRLINKAANGLRSAGVGYQDKVALHLNNSPEFLITWFACAKLGAVMVPSNVHHLQEEMEYVLSFSDAVAVITEEDYIPRLQPILPKLSKLKTAVIARTDEAHEEYIKFQDWLEHEDDREPDAPVKQSDVLEMIFTSGTTALPKGVLLTHANHLSSGQRVSKHTRLTPKDRTIGALPLFHVNAQSNVVLGTLTVGGTVIMLEQYSARRYLQQIIEHKATRTSIVSMHLRTMLAQPASEQDRAHQLESVTFAINVSDADKEAFEERFGVQLLNGYGLSEAMTLVTLAPIDGIRKWPSIGLPVFDREVKIVDDAGHEVPPGDIGEIIVKGIPGKTIMQGYYKNEQATEEAIKDGCLHTGDKGYMDEQGYLYFYDRKKDVIKQAGENISASEIEGILMKHPKIKEAAVIGVEDHLRDEVVKAFIVTEANEELKEDDLISWCHCHMAKFKVPRYFEFREELPHTSIGKIEKRLLRRQELEKKNTTING